MNNKQKLSLKKPLLVNKRPKKLDDKILFLCQKLRLFKVSILRSFYLYSVKKSSQFRSGYLFLLGAAIIFLLFRQSLLSLFCLVPSLFLYFSPLVVKNILESIRKQALANSRLLPPLIKKYHSDYKTLRFIRVIIKPFHFKRLF